MQTRFPTHTKFFASDNIFTCSKSRKKGKGGEKKKHHIGIRNNLPIAKKRQIEKKKKKNFFLFYSLSAVVSIQLP